MDRFLVQVSRDAGYDNITNNRLYDNDRWASKPRDRDHGEVKPGDELLVYCTSNVPNHGMSLALSALVKGVSSDKVTFELDEPRLFKSPIQRDELLRRVDRNELPKVFRRCGHQGFNITKLEASAAQRILELAARERDDGVDQTNLPSLADRLLLTTDFLREIKTLLNDKKQVIFQGPPGTGKTYVAQALAEHLAGSEDRVTLVQLHPSYAYEDFVQGFRPTLEDGQPGFQLKDGPLLRAAERAESEPNAKHFLVIDEINRGNPAKVFGELYFLLEYRDREMVLQYSNEPFSLPENLYIIGTMNTADRSIALVDLALRRRFCFVEFHPDDEPVKGVLRRWLKANAPGMDWLANVVERANEMMHADRHAAIGPSYFMKSGLDEDAVKRIWKHSVLPYIEELLFRDDNRIKELDLETLRRETDRRREEDERQAEGEDIAGNEGGGPQ